MTPGGGEPSYIDQCPATETSSCLTGAKRVLSYIFRTLTGLARTELQKYCREEK